MVKQLQHRPVPDGGGFRHADVFFIVENCVTYVGLWGGKEGGLGEGVGLVDCDTMEQYGYPTWRHERYRSLEPTVSALPSARRTSKEIIRFYNNVNVAKSKGPAVAAVGCWRCDVADSR